jgi:hypothetical protein
MSLINVFEFVNSGIPFIAYGRHGGWSSVPVACHVNGRPVDVLTARHDGIEPRIFRSISSSFDLFRHVFYPPFHSLSVKAVICPSYEVVSNTKLTPALST